MRGELLSRSSFIVGTFLVALLLAGNFFTRASAQEDEERRLWDSGFLKKRQAAKTGTPARRRTAYRRATPRPPESDDKTPGEMLGITIWRLRPSSSSDTSDARLLLQEEDKEKTTAVEFTPERVEGDTSFAAGDRVRLSIESSRTGYLYVIDRELYADGTVSEPYLIYPTLRNRGGNNAVAAGKVIELPENSAFKLTPMRADYRGERLTLLVTAEPIGEITVTPRHQKLDAALVERWEKQWGAVTERFEMIDGAGKAYTRVEKEAGAGRVLTQDDDLPQTLFRVSAGPGAPVLVTLPLKIGK